MMATVRKLLAAAAESPTPVPAAIQAARQRGHFGRIARMMPGNKPPVIPQKRRASLDFGSPWQHW